jgi:hypothetical protein
VPVDEKRCKSINDSMLIFSTLIISNPVVVKVSVEAFYAEIM